MKGMCGSTATRCVATSQPVQAGDVVTVALDRAVRVLKVTGFAERRGDARSGAPAVRGSHARAGTEAAATRRRSAVREPGSGRPTKQERRAIDRLMGGEESWIHPVAKATQSGFC